MDNKKIRELLQKYYNGDTTLNEEETLRRYFIDNPDISKEFLIEKEQFTMIDKAKNQDVPFDDFEAKLETIIDNQKVKYPVFRRKKTWIQIAGIAACILIFFGIYNSVEYFKNKSKYKDTIDDPYMAYQETKRTLLYISEKFNYGTKELTNISKINSSMQMLKPISKLDQGFGKLQLLLKISESENINNK